MVQAQPQNQQKTPAKQANPIQGHAPSRKQKRETGVFWDEPLPLYLDGAININLYNNVLGFMAGEPISGTVDIEIGVPYEASDLVVEFKGVERCHLDTDDLVQLKDMHREVKEILTMKQVMVQFPEGQRLEPGQYSYPFQIFTPSWLPESSIFKTKKDRFTVEYTIRAQFSPRDPTKYVDHPLLPGKYWNVSTFRGSRRVHVYQKPQEIPAKNYKLTIKSNVGLRLFGSTESTCGVKFVKNQYYPGEMVDIWLDCDNSQCDKAVKSYKFKLHRQLRCREALSGTYDTFITNLKTVKEKGCAAKSKEQKHFQFQIPLMEKDCSDEATNMLDRTSKAIMRKDTRKQGLTVHKDSEEEEEKKFQDLCPSWMGQIFQVQYFLKVYVKHDGFFERGQGKYVHLPLRIMATPRTEPSSEPWRIPSNWNPYQGTQEPTFVYLQNPDEKPQYMTKFIDNNWAKWEANLAPVIAAPEDEQKNLQQKRNTIKMNAHDPDEDALGDRGQNPFAQAPEASLAERQFNQQQQPAQPLGQPQAQVTAQPQQQMDQHQAYQQPVAVPQQQPVVEQPVEEPSFYDQFLKGKAADDPKKAAAAQQQPQASAGYEQEQYYQQDGSQQYQEGYQQSAGQQVYYDENGNPQYYDASQQQYQEYGAEQYQAHSEQFEGSGAYQADGHQQYY